MMQTNFNTWQPELGDEPVCQRYQYGAESLKAHPESTPENVLHILEHTHQDSLTAYSNMYDLTAGTITIYDKLDFRHGRTLRISELIKQGDCMRRLHDWVRDNRSDCIELATSGVSGKVINAETGEPLQYANVGIEGRNIGTLTDPDGSFTLDIPENLTSSQISFSYVGFDTQRIPAVRPPSGNPVIRLRPNSRMLQEVVVKAHRMDRRARVGWMGGRDGVLPLDSMTGGAAVALLLKLPSTPSVVEKLQLRLMYNSHDTVKLRLHFYAFDTVLQKPGKELLSREVILRDQKRFGWMRFDLEEYDIELETQLVCVGFEWIENRDSRTRMIRGLANWEAWKKQQFEAGDQSARKVTRPDGTIGYEFHGNMMNWPGFKELPPFTGLMIEKGKQEKTNELRTFVRKTSFGSWTEIPSTLNAVVTVSSAKR